MYIVDKNKTSCVFILLFFWFSACKEDPARHLNLGDWYLNKGLIEEAIDEYKDSGVSPDMNNLVEERHQELVNAARELGVTDVRFLGYNDEIMLPREDIINDIA